MTKKEELEIDFEKVDYITKVTGIPYLLIHSGSETKTIVGTFKQVVRKNKCLCRVSRDIAFHRNFMQEYNLIERYVILKNGMRIVIPIRNVKQARFAVARDSIYKTKL